MQEQYQAAVEILSEKVTQFENWYECRNLIPAVECIASESAREVAWRMGGNKNYSTIDQSEELSGQVQQAAEKEIKKMLFSLRDQLEVEDFRKCITVLEELYQCNENQKKGEQT